MNELNIKDFKPLLPVKDMLPQVPFRRVKTVGDVLSGYFSDRQIPDDILMVFHSFVTLIALYYGVEVLNRVRYEDNVLDVEFHRSARVDGTMKCVVKFDVQFVFGGGQTCDIRASVERALYSKEYTKIDSLSEEHSLEISAEGVGDILYKAVEIIDMADTLTANRMKDRLEKYSNSALAEKSIG